MRFKITFKKIVIFSIILFLSFILAIISSDYISYTYGIIAMGIGGDDEINGFTYGDVEQAGFPFAYLTGTIIHGGKIAGLLWDDNSFDKSFFVLDIFFYFILQLILFKIIKIFYVKIKNINFK